MIHNGHTIAERTRGSFVAEMSFLTGGPSTADVHAQGEVRYMAWEQESLRQLERSNPPLLIRIQGVLGKSTDHQDQHSLVTALDEAVCTLMGRVACHHFTPLQLP